MMGHEFEPIRGLPATLPKDETILWQGSPSAWPLATHAFRLPWVAAYFAIVMAWMGVNGNASVAAAVWMTSLAAAAIGVLATLAVVSARTTVYTITSRRIVMRIGMALPICLNVPFAMVDGAALSRFRDGSGGVSIQLRPGQRVAWLFLWPHARPGRLARPEPMMRGLRDPAEPAKLLARALAAASGTAPVNLPEMAVATPHGARPVEAH